MTTYDGFDNVAMEIDWDRMSPMELMKGPKIVITIALDNALPWDKEAVLAKCLDAIEREADEADDALPILLMQGEWIDPLATLQPTEAGGQ